MEPKWKTNYPVKRSEERRVTRRQFAGFCGCAAVALGAGAWAKGPLMAPPEGAEELDVAGADEVPVGGYRLFRYPTPDHPCILVRLEEDRFAAFGQRCTHLSCPVHFDPLSRQFVCPCHDGFFDAETGEVLAGPPQRPLPRYAVRVESGRVWVGGRDEAGSGELER